MVAQSTIYAQKSFIRYVTTQSKNLLMCFFFQKLHFHEDIRKKHEVNRPNIGTLTVVTHEMKGYRDMDPSCKTHSYKK